LGKTFWLKAGSGKSFRPVTLFFFVAGLWGKIEEESLSLRDPDISITLPCS
jgi:hypothetical protein